MMTFLKRVDPEANMDRWYMVFVQASLFDPVAVIYAWGSRRTSYYQMRVRPAKSTADALAIADKIVKQKVNRGYEIVSEINNPHYKRPSSRKISLKTSMIPASSSAVIGGLRMAKASPSTVSK